MKQYIVILVLFLSACTSNKVSFYEQALENGRVANEGFVKSNLYLESWMAVADSATGLIPRNLADSKTYWNAKDAAADNYPFMVLTSSILRPDLFHTCMLDMLHTETKLTSRIGRLPDTYSFKKQDFLTTKVDTSEIVFGSAEYMKDGLIPLTEWLGKSPWSERMIGILDDLENVMDGPLLNAPKYTNEKNTVYIASLEVNGDLLQVFARMYWMTGNKRYYERGIQLADYYFSDENLPTRNDKGLKLRDHGCEIIAGLSEMYATAHYVDSEKKKQWTPYMHEILDNILSKGRNEDGLFYNSINPVTGAIIDEGIADTWGYTLNSFYTVYLLDGVESYKEAVVKALQSINKYKRFNWENYNAKPNGADGYADAIESAINLYFRIPFSEVASWIDSEIREMWAIQQPSGIIEGWHGDGNFARTTLMYCLWKTAGITLSDWNQDIIYGAVVRDDELYVSLVSSQDWKGKLLFGKPMYQTNLNLQLNYPRINQFQEWYPVDANGIYIITGLKQGKLTVKGKELIDGYEIIVEKDVPLYIHVTKVRNGLTV